MDYILIILLLYGLVILNRLISRQSTLIAFTRSMQEIQNYFSKRDPEIAIYLDKQKEIFRGERYKEKKAP